MFTGIVTDIGSVRALSRNGDTRFEIATAYETRDIAIGASIACSGACLTVIDKGPGWFAVQASTETMRRTNLAAWQVGRRVNLERALRAGDELGGHIVSGHVDGVGQVVAVLDEGDSRRLVFRLPERLARFIAEKGSVAVDGVSLTVNGVSNDRFDVMIIPHTRAVTTLGALAAGDPVNVEIDMLARYVARLGEME